MSLSDPILAVIVERLDTIKEEMQHGFDGTHERLDQFNGRLRHTEEVARVLEDRSERNEAGIRRCEDDLISLKTQGCALGAALHADKIQVVAGSGWTKWSPVKRGAAVAGVGGVGAAVLFGIVEIAKLIAHILGYN